MGRGAFTLVEMSVVVAILVVLASLIFATMSAVRERAVTSIAMSNLRQMALANQFYVSERGLFPPGIDFGYATTWDGALQPYVGSAGGGWGENIQPVFEDPARRIEPPAAAIASSVYGVLGYSANPVLFLDIPGTGLAPGSGLPMLRVQRPSQTILFITGGQMGPGDNARASIFARSDGGVYDSSESNAEDVVFPSDSDAVEGGGWPGPEAPAYRHQGKALAAMVDGSVQSFAPGELKKKHFQTY